MDEAQIQRVMSHPEFQSMAKKKTSLGLIFTGQSHYKTPKIQK